MNTHLRDRHTSREKPAYNVERRKHIVLLLLGLCMFTLIVAGVIAVSENHFVWERITFIGMCFFFFSTALAEKSFEKRLNEKPWSELATQTGLTYETGKLLLGRPARVTGTYRNYRLSLYTYKLGRGNPCTRIEVALNRPTGRFLRLRGPYERSEVLSEAAFDRVFGAGSLYSIGYERFFVRSFPRRLAISLFGTDGRRHGPLRYRLLSIKQLANIELDGYRLHFEQFGALTDIGYVQSIFDLLVDIAEAVEEQTATN